MENHNKTGRVWAWVSLVVLIVIIWGLGYTRKEIRADVFINAPVEKVWVVLTNFADYPKWNPYMREVHGTLAPGKQLEIMLQPVGARPINIHPTVISVQPPREIHWREQLIMPGIYGGDYTCTVVRISDTQSRVFQREVYTGIIVLPSLRWLEDSVGNGFIQMNAALKFWTEGRPMIIQPSGTLISPPRSATRQDATMRDQH